MRPALVGVFEKKEPVMSDRGYSVALVNTMM